MVLKGKEQSAPSRYGGNGKTETPCSWPPLIVATFWSVFRPRLVCVSGHE